MDWIIKNQVLLSALTNVILAALTALLVLINIFYVRASWKMMRLMESDVKIRTYPRPRVSVKLSKQNANGELNYLITVRTANAPMRLTFLQIGIKYSLNVPDDFEFEHSEVSMLRLNPAVILVGQEWEYFGSMTSEHKLLDEFSVGMRYTDMAGYEKYETLQIGDSYLIRG